MPAKNTPKLARGSTDVNVGQRLRHFPLSERWPTWEPVSLVRVLCPFLVTLEPKADSGDTPVVHTSLEFVYCLEGHLVYEVDGQVSR
jgi:hypothetical protein